MGDSGGVVGAGLAADPVQGHLIIGNGQGLARFDLADHFLFPKTIANRAANEYSEAKMSQRHAMGGARQTAQPTKDPARVATGQGQALAPFDQHTAGQPDREGDADNRAQGAAGIAPPHP